MVNKKAMEISTLGMVLLAVAGILISIFILLLVSGSIDKQWSWLGFG